MFELVNDILNPYLINVLSFFLLKLSCVQFSTLINLPPSLCYFLLSPWGEVEIGPHLSSRHSCTNGYTNMNVQRHINVLYKWKCSHLSSITDQLMDRNTQPLKLLVLSGHSRVNARSHSRDSAVLLKPFIDLPIFVIQCQLPYKLFSNHSYPTTNKTKCMQPVFIYTWVASRASRLIQISVFLV